MILTASYSCEDNKLRLSRVAEAVHLAAEEDE